MKLTETGSAQPHATLNWATVVVCLYEVIRIVARVLGVDLPG
jgi:uncharacterized membrane protein (DUF2068 family)